MKLLKRLSCIMLIAALLVAFPFKAEAASEMINYHELFIEYKNVDGMGASKYQELVYQVYIYNPQRFITELSKEDTDTVLHHSFYLTFTQSYPETSREIYENELKTQLAAAPEGSALADALTLMLYGYMVYHTAESGYTKYVPTLRAALQDDPELFLTSLTVFKGGLLPELISMMAYKMDEAELDAMESKFTACTTADWATPDITDTVDLICGYIEDIRNAPPPATEPNPTEPTSPPPTSAPDPTEPDPIEPEPTAPPQEEPNHFGLIAASVVSIALIACIIAYLLHKKKTK